MTKIGQDFLDRVGSRIHGPEWESRRQLPGVVETLSSVLEAAIAEGMTEPPTSEAVASDRAIRRLAKESPEAPTVHIVQMLRAEVPGLTLNVAVGLALKYIGNSRNPPTACIEHGFKFNLPNLHSCEPRRR